MRVSVREFRRSDRRIYSRSPCPRSAIININWKQNGEIWVTVLFARKDGPARIDAIAQAATGYSILSEPLINIGFISNVPIPWI